MIPVRGLLLYYRAESPWQMSCGILGHLSSSAPKLRVQRQSLRTRRLSEDKIDMHQIFLFQMRFWSGDPPSSKLDREGSAEDATVQCKIG